MAANLTTTYASQILDLLGLPKFKECPPPCPPIKISLGQRETRKGTYCLVCQSLQHQESAGRLRQRIEEVYCRRYIIMASTPAPDITAQNVIPCLTENISST